MIRVLKENDVCEQDICLLDATTTVYSRERKRVIVCCDSCADVVLEEYYPEYVDKCENCGCMQGVN